jgi:hypothetical protein
MIAAGYVTDLYCDCEECTRPGVQPEFDEFTGQSKAETYRQARRFGWRISADQERAFAPGHKIKRCKR